MQNQTKNFIFTMDSFTPEQCSGWYIRKDGKDDYFKICRDQSSLLAQPDVERPDVVSAGYANRMCGFNLKFDPPLISGENVVFRDVENEELFSGSISEAPVDAINAKLMRLVEPFVEIDIARVRTAIMNEKIKRQYRSSLEKAFRGRDLEEFRRMVIEILADMKTTQHLLAAAYLDEVRYKDPDFMESLPDFIAEDRQGFEVDFATEITGANWSQPEKGGRWLLPGERASLLLPAFGTGFFTADLWIDDEVNPGDLDKLRIIVNGTQIPCGSSNRGTPAHLEFGFTLAPAEPFVTMYFLLDADARPDSSLHFRKLGIARNNS